MPETRDPHAGTEVDWWGMATIGGAVFCLTYGLVEANNKGWGSPLIVSLFVASVLLAVAFAFSQRLGRYPMLTPALVRNRQFMGACASLLLFATGMMGALFLAVIAFVNLWGYSELEAALAISPIAIMAMLTSPFVGRFSERLQPRVFGVPALIVMAGGLLALSGIPAEPSLGRAIWPLVLIGLGVGGTFPAVSIGSMGSIRGQELGLGSGIVNMSRQVGFAVGVALLVAVFTGTIDNHLATARHEVAALTRESGLTGAAQRRLDRFALVDPSNPAATRPKPRTPVEREAKKIVNERVRDSYAAAFRVAALAALLGVPFSLTMRRRPSDAAVAEAGAAAG
jgi:hypothetical protein